MERKANPGSQTRRESMSMHGSVRGLRRSRPIACSNDSPLLFCQLLTCSAHSLLTRDTRTARAHCSKTRFLSYPVQSAPKTTFSGKFLGKPFEGCLGVHAESAAPLSGATAWRRLRGCCQPVQLPVRHVSLH